MPIPFSCQCGKKLRAKDEFGGRRMKCPACARVLQIPRRAPAKVLKDGKIPALLESPFKDQGAPATASPFFVRFACACGRRLKARRADAGGTVECPACGQEMAVPAVDTVPPLLRPPVPPKPPRAPEPKRPPRGPEPKPRPRAADPKPRPKAPLSHAPELEARPAPLTSRLDPAPLTSRTAQAPLTSSGAQAPLTSGGAQVPLVARSAQAPLTSRGAAGPATTKAVLAPVLSPLHPPQDTLFSQTLTPWRDDDARLRAGPAAEPEVRSRWLLPVALVLAVGFLLAVGSIGMGWFGAAQRASGASALIPYKAVPPGALEVQTVHVSALPQDAAAKKNSILWTGVRQMLEERAMHFDEMDLDRVTLLILPLTPGIVRPEPPKQIAKEPQPQPPEGAGPAQGKGKGKTKDKGKAKEKEKEKDKDTPAPKIAPAFDHVLLVRLRQPYVQQHVLTRCTLGGTFPKQFQKRPYFTKKEGSTEDLAVCFIDDYTFAASTQAGIQNFMLSQASATPQAPWAKAMADAPPHDAALAINQIAFFLEPSSREAAAAFTFTKGALQLDEGRGKKETRLEIRLEYRTAAAAAAAKEAFDKKNSSTLKLPAGGYQSNLHGTELTVHMEGADAHALKLHAEYQYFVNWVAEARMLRPRP